MLQTNATSSKVQCVNMQRLREKIKMMSVNQMAVYHTIMEVFNIIHNSSSEQIQNKYIHQERHSLRKKAIYSDYLFILLYRHCYLSP